MASLSIAGRASALAGGGRAAMASSRRGFSAMMSAVDEFPDLPNVTPTPAKSGQTQLTKLDCGLVVATEDGSSSSTVSLTFPTGGSSSEIVPSESGAALANKCFAFKAASDMSAIGILRAMQNCGAMPFTSATRYGASVGYTASPDQAPDLVGAVVTATNSSFERWDVKDTLALAKSEAEEANSSPQIVLTEQLYSAAYGAQSALGKPFFYTGGATAAGLTSFRQRTYVLDGAVLVATGIDNHDDFVSETVDAILENDPDAMKKSPGDTDAAAIGAYMGGEARLMAPCSGTAHVAVSLRGPSDSLPLLGVVKHCLSLAGASAFAVPGLVGVYGSSPAAEAVTLTDSLCSALTSKISADVVARAKKLAKAEAAFALETGSRGLAEAMTSNILSSGSFTKESVAASYDTIMDKDVNEAVAAMLKSNPSVAAVGEVEYVPYHATVASRFG